MIHSIFLQHLVLAAFSGLTAVVCVVLGAVLNRKMTRIEIAVNGRVDELLRRARVEEEADAKDSAEPPPG